MTGNRLKLLAIILMTIDHIGVILFPQNILLRIIGRLSFPIFAFLIVQGFKHTRSYGNYLIRLVSFAFVSELVYDISIYGEFSMKKQNIFFTLAFALIGLKLLQLAEQKKTPLLLFLMQFAVLLILVQVLNVDYGLYGVMTVVILYLADIKEKPWITFGLFLLLNVSYLPIYGILQMFSIFALFILLIYNGKKGKRVNKLNYYIYYPVHLALLSIISEVTL